MKLGKLLLVDTEVAKCTEGLGYQIKSRLNKCMGSSGQGALPQLSNAPPFGESPIWGIFSLVGCLCSSEDHAMTSQQGKFQALSALLITNLINPEV